GVPHVADAVAPENTTVEVPVPTAQAPGDPASAVTRRRRHRGRRSRGRALRTEATPVVAAPEE
ncbi:MAG: hypothetical protein ACHQHM_03300, partial [Thermoanaerobaculales bacterium]